MKRKFILLPFIIAIIFSALSIYLFLINERSTKFFIDVTNSKNGFYLNISASMFIITIVLSICAWATFIHRWLKENKI